MHRKIKGIISERAHNKYRSFQIVTSWENIIAKELGFPIINRKGWYSFIIRQITRLKLEGIFLYLDSFIPRRNFYLYYCMEVKTFFQWTGVRNIIPIVIDFWLKDEELELFYNNYRNCNLILITSREVFEKLKNDNCPLNIEHFPLSLPDEYIQNDVCFDAKYIDFLFAGRMDPVFMGYIKQYELEYPTIEYVYQELENLIPFYISNKRGRLVGDFFSSEGYLSLLKSAKIAFYTTPGVDPAKIGANQYNQVTPRFLELLSNGCLLLGRYTDNPDVSFFEIENLCPNISCYADFKFYVKQYLEKDYSDKHLKKYPEYLAKHTTKKRVLLLEKILKENKFSKS